jgi:hypothetical protein
VADDARLRLTRDQLRSLPPGIFAQGVTVDGPEGVNFTGSGAELRWVAVRGEVPDWAIYCAWADWPWEQVAAAGDKIHDDADIRRLVPCDDEALAAYRH